MYLITLQGINVKHKNADFYAFVLKGLPGVSSS